MRKRLLIASMLVVAACLGGGAAHAQDAPRSARVGDYFTQEEIARAERYRGPRYALGFTALGLSTLVLFLIGGGRGARWLGDWTSSLTGARWWLQAILLSIAVIVLQALVTLPFGLLRHRQDRRFGLATNTVPEYLTDWLKANLVQIAISAIAAVLFVGVARALPRAWPVAAAAVGAALTIALVYLFPVVYEPLFNTFEPVDQAQRERVLAVADRAGVRVNDVLVADASRRTTRQNAYVSGLGNSRRVVLYDTLLAKSSPRQVDLVVAHELGHVKHNDVVRGTLLGVVGIIAGIIVLRVLLGSGVVMSWAGASGPGDARIVPFLALFMAVSSLLTMPVANAYSRSQEASADRFALDVTGDVGTAISVEVDLARDSISDLTPNPFVRWMFFTHPPTMERIRASIAYAREHDLPVPPTTGPSASP